MPAPIAIRRDIFDFGLDPRVAYTHADLGRDGRLSGGRILKHVELVEEIESVSLKVEVPHTDKKPTGKILDIKAEVVVEIEDSDSGDIAATDIVVEDRDIDVTLPPADEQQGTGDGVVVIASSKKMRAKKVEKPVS